MPPIASSQFSSWMLQVLPVAFLAITFLQSGLDKVFDWKGNLSWLTGYFAKTPVLRGLVKPMFLTLTVLELATGGVCAAGVVALVVTGNSGLAALGAMLAGITFLALLFGQRIVKDYPGAAGSVPYFLVSLAALLVTRG
ncbi:DoxX family protein [Stigmatella sp. ncwal1]|uniref:DoxX family protein n=1 Tax=Stigmatella ashevillensis TaxID=2995309 RepID=A0ABT5DP40_9BACT|nr:DoxX family protein [Stigmatella ashevillena]MDC0714136.1 DoxX family protein [Stigmatella ashevillena]